MSAARKPNLRPLKAEDLERVVEIDRPLSGRSRRGFFKSRLAAAEDDPETFIAVAVDDGKVLQGFAIARIQTGEFGDEEPVAILDTIGVETGHQARGLGRILMNGLDEGMRKRGVHEMRTQADWTSQSLIRFFAEVGFTLAPRLALERPATRNLDF